MTVGRGGSLIFPGRRDYSRPQDCQPLDASKSKMRTAAPFGLRLGSLLFRTSPQSRHVGASRLSGVNDAFGATRWRTLICAMFFGDGSLVACIEVGDASVVTMVQYCQILLHTREVIS